MFYNRYITFVLAFCYFLALGQGLFAKPLHVVSITQDFESITKRIGGDLVTTESLIKGSRNLHHITPKPSMVMALRKADLIIRLGMDQDTWIDSLIEASRNSSLFPGQRGYLDASITIEKLEVPAGNIDGRHGDIHLHGNPHYTLNPKNGQVIALAIRNKLIELDPANTPTYNQNYTTFTKDLTQKIALWSDKLSKMPKTQFMTYHKVWPYFFTFFDLKTFGEVEVLPGIPPTTTHLLSIQKNAAQISDKKVLLSSNFYPEHVGKKVANSIDATYIRVPINVGEKNIETYIGMFDHIVDQLTKK